MNVRKGIILTGGTGTRTAPFNQMFNKHLLPLYNRFIIDFPLDTLRGLGVVDLTVVLGGEHSDQIRRYFELNNNCGFEKVNFVNQLAPSGIAQAINLCHPHIGDERFVTILGDNYYEKRIKFNDNDKAQIVLCQHQELKRFGVCSIVNGKIVKLEEKPQIIDESMDGNFAMTGCYLFDKQYFEYFKNIQKSSRGEYEIVDVINHYKDDNKLYYVITDGQWSDAGTLESIHHVSNQVRNKFLSTKG